MSSNAPGQVQILGPKKISPHPEGGGASPPLPLPSENAGCSAADGDNVIQAKVAVRESDIDFDCISVPGVWFYYEMDISYREPRLEGLYLSNTGATVDLFR